MEYPKPPEDIELKNIIDKLAQFVARNGPDFEQMTKNKQKGNAKFDFLFGGEYFHYYRHKVNAEQACMNMELNGHSSRSAPPPPPPPPLPPTALGNPVHWLASSQNTVSSEMLASQQVSLNEQIRESEMNLNAQHAVLLQQQQYAIDEAISKAEESILKSAATECGINFSEFDAVLQPIIDTCTKDAISAGKSWIIQRATAAKTNSVISEYLQSKVIESSASFNRRLHIIYLLNDTFHHCMRKGADDLKKALEKVLIPMFCTASLDVNDEQQQKLQKLLNLWENKNHYFSKEIINKLKNPTVSLTEYKSELVKKHSNIVEECVANTKSTMDQYQSQHQAFVNHALQQIQNLEKQKQLIEQQNTAPPLVNASGSDDFHNVDTNVRPQLSGSNDVGPQSSTQLLQPPPLQQQQQEQDKQQLQQDHQHQILSNDHKERTNDNIDRKDEERDIPNHIPQDNNNRLNSNYNQELPPINYDSGVRCRNNSSSNTNHDVDIVEHPPPFNGSYWNSQDNLHCEPLPAKVVDYQHQDPSLRLHNAGAIQDARSNCTTRDYFHQSNPSEEIQNSAPDYFGGPSMHQDSLMRTGPPPPYDAEQPFTRRGQDHQQLPQSLPFYRHDQRPFASVPQPFNQELPPQVPFHQPPPGFPQPFIPPNVPLPDLSRPPPLLNNIPPLMSLPPPDFVPDEMTTTMPYYELPAGLMVPLVRLEDSEYKPLDPDDIKLPPPAPPTDRLLAAVKAFYSPPGHDRPRDSEGWEKLGLYEYYRAKGLAKQQKADDIGSGIRPKSKTPSPVRRPKSKSRSPPNRKRYRSRSRSKSKGRGSRSPRPRSKRSPRRSNRDRRRDRSRSPSCSSPPVSDVQRSPTPPSFFGSTYGKYVEKIDESNKGHQLLRKMGWGGAGLGAKEQGIEDPISGGEVRDRQDQYKGVGINLNDPFESFRKSKGQAFISRMKERAEERLGA